MLIALLAAAASTAAPPSTRPACAPASLAACTSTNQLIWSKPFLRDLRAFLGEAKASYLQVDRPVFDQAQAVLGGPPDDPVRLADGAWMFTACRAHSCPEKGAVVLSAAGRILAVGILHFGCGVGSGPTCAETPRLALILRGGTPTVSARTAVERWARASDPTLAGVDVTTR